jgi:hypothetical protein
MTLETLLQTLCDEAPTAALVEQARAMVQGDDRVPAELQEVVFQDLDEAESDAVALLAVLGSDTGLGELLREAIAHEGMAIEAEAIETPQIRKDDLEEPWVLASEVRAAITDEAGTVQITEPVLARVSGAATDWVYGPAIRSALLWEAGPVSVAPAVLQALAGSELPPVAEAIRQEAGQVPAAQGLPVASALRAEAGTVDVVDVVFASLGLANGTSIDAALRSEAGPMDLANAVCVALQHAHPPVGEAVRDEAGDVSLADGVVATIEGKTLPSALGTELALPAPANRPWSWGAVLAAAIVFLVVGTSQLFPQGPGIAQVAEMPMQFASAAEVVVEDLDYGASVQVMQTEGDEGALIIWVDEEVTL